MAWRIVIAGGGFGGFYAARELEKVLPPQAAHITLVNDVNFMLYTPLLPGAAAGTLEPRHVVVPLREELHRTDLRLGEVLSADPAQKSLHIRTIEGHEERLDYDHLIVALGSVSRTLPIPGLAEHAIGFKTLAEAIALRNHLLRTLEMAETVDDAARAREVPHLRVRGRRLRRRRGAGRAAGLRRRRHRPLPALAACRACAGCWSRPPTGSCARSPRPGRLHHARAAGPRHRVPPRHPGGGDHRRDRAPLQRRDAAHAHAGVDGGRSAPSGRGPARAAARRAGASWSTRR